MAFATFSVSRQGWVALTGAVANCQIGNWAGQSNVVREVAPGDEIRVEQPTKGCRIYVQFGTQGRAGRVPPPDFNAPVHLVVGPDFNLFDQEFPAFAVTSRQMDRIGVRLNHLAAFRHSLELPSKPQTPGSIQVTPAGELIVIGPDGPVTGGYPQPFVVTRAWLSRVGQWRPGQTVQMIGISPDQARLGWQRAEMEITAKLQDYRLGLAT